jgi:cytoskeletal protein RodZ
VIGTPLRAARARRKLSYDLVEAETKIRAKYIRCLEEEDFDTLPSATYVKGFLRTYADYLGLDGQLYVDEYNSRFGDLHAEDALFRRRERPPARRRRSPGSSNAVLIALAAIVSIAVLVIVAWRYGTSQQAVPPVGTVVTNPPAGNQALPTAPTTTHHRVHHTQTVAKKQAPPAPVELALQAVGADVTVVWYQRGVGGKPVYRGVIANGTTVGPTRFPVGFVIVSATPSDYLRLLVGTHTYALTGTTGRWLVTRKGVFDGTGAALTPAA